jgi:hypothetical protein
MDKYKVTLLPEERQQLEDWFAKASLPPAS